MQPTTIFFIQEKGKIKRKYIIFTKCYFALRECDEQEA